MNQAWYARSKCVKQKSTYYTHSHKCNTAINDRNKHPTRHLHEQSASAYSLLLADTVISFLIIIIVAFFLFTSCAGKNLSPIYIIIIIAQHLLMHQLIPTYANLASLLCLIYND